MVLAWEPDWAVAATDDFREQMSRNRYPGTFVGWLTYYSRQWGEVPALPVPARVEPVEDKGLLVVLSPERLTAANPEHVSLGHRIQGVLEERGLLREVLEPRA
ncbi:immunity 52 family protein [Archangium violaceum]|nr:immunity 52 family protein [Archangium violaceum]